MTMMPSGGVVLLVSCMSVAVSAAPPLERDRTIAAARMPVTAPLTMSLTASALAAANRSGGHLTQALAPDAAPRSCRKRTALATGIGAGAGAAVAAGLLALTGGSDSTYSILFKFAGAGSIVGLTVGAAACRR